MNDKTDVTIANCVTMHKPLSTLSASLFMKIAIDIREAVRSKKAGKGWYTHEMVECLLKNHPEDTFVLYTDQPYPLWEHYKNAIQKFFPPSPLRWHFKVLKDLKMLKPDIYFAPTSYIIPSFAPKWLRVVATVHDLVAWLFATRHHLKATIIERITLPLAVKRITKFVSVSENTKRDLRHFFRIPSENIEVIPCGVDERFTPLSSSEKEAFKRGRKLPRHFLLAVGTLEPRKNFVRLIKAFAEVVRKHPEYSLVIIGGKGWYFEKIFETVKSYELEDSVLFAGYVEEKDLVGYYNVADGFIFPSLYEGFGIPPLEAMKSGCPVIASNISSIPEVVEGAGILVDPSSISGLRDAMIRLIESPELREELSRKGREQSKKFTWRSAADQLYRLFEDLVKKP